MAFEFLKGIGDLITAGAGIYSLFDKREPYGEIPTLQPMLAEIERAKTYEQAALDPESSMSRNLAAIFAESDRKNAIKEGMGQILRERRAIARGDIQGGGVRAERRDEGRYRALLELFDSIRDKSREQAVNSLLTAARGARSNVQAYSPFLQLFGNYADVNQANKLGGIEAVGGALGALSNVLGGGGGAAGGQRPVIGMPWLAPPAAREISGMPWLDQPPQRQPQIAL